MVCFGPHLACVLIWNLSSCAGFKDHPRDQLEWCKRIQKPTPCIEKNKSKQAFKKKETREAMPIGSTQCKDQKKDRKCDEDSQINHSQISHSSLNPSPLSYRNHKPFPKEHEGDLLIRIRIQQFSESCLLFQLSHPLPRIRHFGEVYTVFEAVA